MLSVITVSYNNSFGLAKTIKSVLNVLSNNFESYEHIIIDGQSTDDSFSIIRDYSLICNNVKFIVEKDVNLYDAMNKGLSVASGSWVYFLNSGDTIVNAKLWAFIILLTRHVNIPITFQTLQNYKFDFYLWGLNLSQLCNANLIAHQGILVPRVHFKDLFFDVTRVIDADTKWINAVNQSSSSFLPLFMVGCIFDLGGISSNPIKSFGLRGISCVSDFLKVILFLIFNQRLYYRIIYMFKYKYIKIDEVKTVAESYNF